MSDQKDHRTPPHPEWLQDDFAHDPTLNLWTLKAASGAFGYNDGDAHEEYVLATMRSARDTSVLSEELSGAMKDWPSTYHLHHQRCNVFRAITDHLDGPILEIGAGCGVLTRYLGELGHEVVALEGSHRRASVIGERCRDLTNVQVVNANFQDFHPNKTFKTITLIGVLEYARVYFSDGSDTDPVEQMLRSVSEKLAPDGVLIVAIENQLGLKYFAGYNEDHFGQRMYGIEDRYDASSIVTFGRAELREKIRASGFEDVAFAYPFPDYKFPQAVLFEPAFAPDVAPHLTSLVAGANASDRQKPVSPYFSMAGAMKPVMRNGLGADLANSFIAIASKSDPGPKPQDAPLAVYFGNGDRKNAFLKTAEITQDDKGLLVRRRPMVPRSDMPEMPARLVLEDEHFVDGTLWTDRLQKLFLNEKWSILDVVDWAQGWASALQHVIGDAAGSGLTKSTRIPGRFLDAVPRNLIVQDDGAGVFIDQEWHATSDFEFGYLFTRGMTDALSALDQVAHKAQPLGLLEITVLVADELGLDLMRAEAEAHLRRERAFQAAVTRFPVGSNDLWTPPVRLSDGTIIAAAKRELKRIKRRPKQSKFLSRLTGRRRG